MPESDVAPGSKDIEDLVRLEFDKAALLTENERAQPAPKPWEEPHAAPLVSTALIGATAVSVLGLVGIVVAGLFKAPSPETSVSAGELSD